MTKRKILYGYQIRGGALEIVPEEQRVVQMLFALYSAGASYQDISDALNRQGVPYSSEIPLWNKHKIKRMLENARLWGDRIFEKCGIRRDEGGDGGKTLEIRGKRRLSARDGGANYQQS